MGNHKEIKAGAGYTIGNILIKGISFISLPIFSRLLTTSDFGLYNTYISYEAILTIIFGLGMHSTIKNAFYDYKGKQKTFISTQSIIVLFVALALTIIYIALSGTINRLTGFTTVIIVFMISQSFGAAMLNIVNAKLTLDYSYKSYLYYAAFNTLLNVLLSLLFMHTFLKSDRLLARIMGSALPLLIIGIFSFIRFTFIKEKKFEKEMFVYALGIGFPLVFHYLSQQIQSQFDRIMITNLVDSASTGIYSFVYTIANIFQIFFYSTDNVWGVWMLGKMEENEYANIKSKANSYMLLVTFVACSMMIVSRELIMIAGPKSYLEGANLFVPIVVGMFFLFLYTIPVVVEYYYKETKYIGATTFIAALFNIVSNYICIKMFGYTAAAYTTLASYILTFGLHWFISRMLLKKRNIKPIFEFSSFLLYIIIVVLVALFVVIFNPYPLIKYLIACVLGITVICFTQKQWYPLVHDYLDRKKK